MTLKQTCYRVGQNFWDFLKTWFRREPIHNVIAAIPAGAFGERVLGASCPLIEGLTATKTDISEKCDENFASESTNWSPPTDSFSAGCDTAGIVDVIEELVFGFVGVAP